MPRRIYTYAPGMGWTSLNQFETVCAFILGLSFLVMYINLIKSTLHGEKRLPIRGMAAASNGRSRRRRQRTTLRMFPRSADATPSG